MRQWWLGALVSGALVAALLGPVESPSAVGQQAAASALPSQQRSQARPELPLGGRTIFPEYVLVAFYGTTQTSAMGVLGEAPPDVITERLRRAARPYRASGRTVQIVYELIVTIADPHPGRDGDYSHAIPRRHVERYIRAARRNDALLLLDLQPGRSTFVEQAMKYRWALRHPFVGLALDPEWRMGPHQVPAQTIGSVGAVEINRVSALLARVTRRHDLPEKLLVIHQFRTSMVRNIDRVRIRARLATVQHVDGFGTRRQKLATYHAVARPDLFHLGFKLFYDEDSNLLTPRRVLGIRPRVELVSHQ